MRARSWGAWLAGLLALLPLLLGAAWSLGFAAFLGAAYEMEAALPAHADGIVVLTGGADRVAAGLRLLTEGRAPALLISGVGRGSGLDSIERGLGQEARVPAAQVALGRAAQTTRGNAEETAAWAHQHGAQSLIVVTAGYHMPRALLEIGRALPGIALYPAPVQSPVLRGSAGPAALRLLAGEFDKWLAAKLGLHQSVTGLALGRHDLMSNAWPSHPGMSRRGA